MKLVRTNVWLADTQREQVWVYYGEGRLGEIIRRALDEYLERYFSEQDKRHPHIEGEGTRVTL